MPNNCYGIVHQDRLILPDDAFREACAGLDPSLVLAPLNDADLLLQDDDQSRAHTKIAKPGLRRAPMLHMTRCWPSQRPRTSYGFWPI